MHESCQSNELLKSEESPWIYGIQLRRVDRMGRIRVVMWTLRPPVVARLRWSLDVEHQPAERLRKNHFNPQRLASVMLLRGRAMDENRSIKINVSFKSAGLKLAGHLYTPDPDTSPSLPAIVVGPPGSSVKEQAARVCTRGCSEDKFKGQLDRAWATNLIERVETSVSAAGAQTAG
jgi:hypothetical protein